MMIVITLIKIGIFLCIFLIRDDEIKETTLKNEIMAVMIVITLIKMCIFLCTFLIRDDEVRETTLTPTPKLQETTPTPTLQEQENEIEWYTSQPKKKLKYRYMKNGIPDLDK